MSLNSAMRAGLQRIYEDLGAAIAEAAPVCELSGKCCRFKEYGHTLFLSRSEAKLLLEPGLPPNSVVDDSSCPFQVQGLCTARENRPLGCRVYFCDPRYAGKGEPLTERFLAQIKELHDAEGEPWEYRPLFHFLQEVRPAAELGKDS